jgi:hypothetical protein
MENEDNKLTEEILEKNISIRGLLDFGNYSCIGIPYEDALKAMQAYHEAKMREEKAKKFYDKNTCVVCHQNYVDSANGFDTCDYCLSRI